MINLIVGLVTLLAFGFVVLWFWSPSFRKNVERPKHDMLRNEERFARNASSEDR